jgi:hypothetical protein
MVPWMLWMGALTIVGKSCVAMAIVFGGWGREVGHI